MYLFSSALGGCFGELSLAWREEGFQDVLTPIYLCQRVLPSQRDYSFINQRHGADPTGQFVAFPQRPFTSKSLQELQA